MAKCKYMRDIMTFEQKDLDFNKMNEFFDKI